MGSIDRRVFRAALSASAAFLALPAGAYAQESQAADTAASAGDIVVTAQKREQRLIDVPVAISVLPAESLARLNVSRLSDYYDRIPGLQYSGQLVSNISLRGISAGSGTSPTVAILVDDVQFGGTTGAGQPPLPDFDASALGRVEVLHGPQGTLYGAASLGGLIKYVLKEPQFDSFSGRVEAAGTKVDVGGSGYALRGSINIPVTDWLAATASAFTREDAPYLDNANAGALKKNNVNTRKVWGFRTAALIRPTDNLRITASALYQHQKALNSDLAATSGGVPVCNICVNGPNATTAPTTFDPVLGDLTINTLDAPNRMKFQLYTGRVEWDLGPAALTSISAWSRADNVLLSDVTRTFGRLLARSYGVATPPTAQISNATKTSKFSQELRLAGKVDAVEWLVGGFYTVEHAATDQTIFASGTVTGTPYDALGPATYREYAGFGDLTWHATDKLDLQVGGRYARNKQNNATTLVLDGPVEGVFGTSGTVRARSKDSAFTWLVSPSYHFSPDILGYVRVASGYRPGGPNIGSPPGRPVAFDSDRVINYEVGFKGRVLPGVLTIDTALFQIDWKDIQLLGTDPVTSLNFQANGGKARSRGLEFAADLTPWRGMSINGNFTVTDAEITEDILTIQGGRGFRGLPGDRLPFVAKFTSNLSAQQSFDLTDDWEMYVGGTLTYVGNRLAGFQTNDPAATRPRIRIPAYTTLDLRAGIIFDKKLSIAPYIRNVFDKRGVAAANNANGARTPTALFINPRTYGVVASISF